MVESGNPLTEWCRTLEERLEETTRERDRLLTENAELAGRVAELTAIVKGLEEAYLLGRLHASGRLTVAAGRLARAGSEASPAPARIKGPESGSSEEG